MMIQPFLSSFLYTNTAYLNWTTGRDKVRKNERKSEREMRGERQGRMKDKIRERIWVALSEKLKGGALLDIETEQQHHVDRELGGFHIGQMGSKRNTTKDQLLYVHNSRHLCAQTHTHLPTTEQQVVFAIPPKYLHTHTQAQTPC